MIAGAVGLAVYAAAIIPLLRRVEAPVASVAAIGVWTAVAAVVAGPLLAA